LGRIAKSGIAEGERGASEALRLEKKTAALLLEGVVMETLMLVLEAVEMVAEAIGSMQKTWRVVVGEWEAIVCAVSCSCE
jgi:hypothetical protein